MRLRRMKKRLDEIQQWVARETLVLQDWTLQGRPIASGTRWQDSGEPLRFAHGPVTVPAHWPLDDVRLHLWLGGEGLVRLIGARTEAFGLNPPHMDFPVSERRFRIEAECVARLEQGVPNRDAALGRTELIWVETDLADLVLLLEQVVEMVRALGGHEVEGWPVPDWFPRRPRPDHSEPHAVCAPLMDVAEAAFHLLDWPTETAAYLRRISTTAETLSIWRLPPLEGAAEPLPERARASVRAARDHLRDGLRHLQTRFPQDGSIALTGHAHIDLAWLWPMAETRRKGVRVFHTVLQLMKQFPEFRFNHSTAQLYDFVGQDDPALLAAITERVTEGRWEPIGGMWVEPDTNMPCGESLIRQLQYGIGYFDRQFGHDKRSTVCWLPDTFGFSPVLPQLLRGVGMSAIFTIKTNWSELHKLPHDLFEWVGLDGSSVTMHTFENPANGYNAELGPRAVLGTWASVQDKSLLGESLLCYGHGDGGGGPTEAQVRRARQMADFPLVPRQQHVNVSDWFRGMAGRLSGELPKWVGEIYLEYHRGTLTTQGRTKYLHRRAERALVSAEILGSMVALRGGAMPTSLEPDWRVLLRNEFHDILPGSSIREVYEVAEAELAQVIAAARVRQDQSLEALAKGVAGQQPGVVVVNPDLSPRPLRLISDQPLPGGQAVEGGHVLSAPEVVPGLSVAAIATTSAPGPLTVSREGLENAFVRLTLAADGTLTSLFDKRAGRECLAGRGNQIWAYVDKPRFFDAWDIEEDYTASGQEILATAIEVAETGPHRAALRITRRFGASTIVQHVRLWANSARVEFHTELDWHDRRVLLKARVPLAIRADQALFECACGVIARPTHRNTPWDMAKFEVPAHRFALMAERGFGVALLNDGKYGHHALGNELGLSLLRAPVFPDLLADEGRQAFTYALLPFSGDWLDAGVLAEAQDLNQPLFAKVARITEGNWQAISAGRGLALSALKPAETGDGLILRLYEPAGGTVRPEIRLPATWRMSGAVNLLEEPAYAAESLTPFAIQSVKLRRD
ncbi:alpha-mannosidase [bacterium]|nr:alpha-mannosidase [bacterium]